MLKFLKTFVKSILQKSKFLFLACSRVLARSGMSDFSNEILAKTDHISNDSAAALTNIEHIPDVITVDIQNCGQAQSASFKMHTVNGKDLVAMDIWHSGWKAFEQPMPQIMAIFASLSRGTFIDIGANTGLYSFICNAENPSLKIHAFEPFPPVSKVLYSNIALNNLGEKIEVSELALGAENGSARFYVPLQDHGLVESSCSLDQGFKDDHSEVIDVKVKKLDTFAKVHKLQDISLLKIDVEGTEHSVLLGGERSYRRPARSFSSKCCPEQKLMSSRIFAKSTITSHSSCCLLTKWSLRRQSSLTIIHGTT